MVKYELIDALNYIEEEFKVYIANYDEKGRFTGYVPLDSVLVKRENKWIVLQGEAL